MNPVETQVADYFSWLDSDADANDSIQLRIAPTATRTRRPLMLAAAAALIAVLVAVGFVLARPSDTEPGRSPDASTTTSVRSTDETVLPPALASSALAVVLSGASVEMAHLPDSVVEAITEVADGAVRLCGFDSERSPEIDTGIRLDSTARRCFLDSYLVGSPAVLVFQGPTFLTAPGVFIWRTHSDRSITIDAATPRSSDNLTTVWSVQPCAGISTDPGSSSDPPEAMHCTTASTPLSAVEAEPPTSFTDRPPLPLCGYSMPSSSDDGPARCIGDALARGSQAEYVVAATDGRSVSWIRTSGSGQYERIDWHVAADGVPSWSQTTCTRSDATDATVPVFGGTDRYRCAAG